MNLLLPAPVSPWRRLLDGAKWAAAGLAVSGGLWLIGSAVATGEDFRVSEVVIEGNSRASATALRHLADVRTGSHLFSIDLDGAVAGVTRHPWVSSATARRQFPGAVLITVEEHRPSALLALGSLWYLDEDGHPFKPATSDDLDYPVLTGLDPELATTRPDLGRAVIQGGLRVLSAWAARQANDTSPFLLTAQVSEVHFDEAYGFELVLRSGTELILGFGEPSRRLSRLDRLIAAGLDLDEPQRVDLDIEKVAIATPLSR